VESESLEEWQAKKSMNVELQSLKPGANVYVLSEPDHETATPCENQLLCFAIVLMATGVGLPLGIILFCILSTKFKERHKKFPLLNLSHQNGLPSKGRSSASSTLWHFLGQGGADLGENWGIFLAGYHKPVLFSNPRMGFIGFSITGFVQLAGQEQCWWLRNELPPQNNTKE